MALFLCALCMTTLTACGDDDDDNGGGGSTIAETLVGNWNINFMGSQLDDSFWNFYQNGTGEYVVGLLRDGTSNPEVWDSIWDTYGLSDKTKTAASDIATLAAVFVTPAGFKPATF